MEFTGGINVNNKVWLHIVFVNGSNPYLFYGSMKEVKKELKKWIVRYKLNVKTYYNGNGNVTGYHAVATENSINITISNKNEELPLF